MDVDTLDGGKRPPGFLAINPNGKILILLLEYAWVMSELIGASFGLDVGTDQLQGSRTAIGELFRLRGSGRSIVNSIGEIMASLLIEKQSG